MRLDFKHFVRDKKSGDDVMYMEMAIAAASQANIRGDKAAGAVLAFPNRHFSDWNTVNSENWPCNHAEANVLNKARDLRMSLKMFEEAVLYCTVEPCVMCATTAASYGIKEIVFGVYDKLDGFVSSSERAIKPEAFGISWRGGVLAHRCFEVVPPIMREHLQIEPVTSELI